jgi:hypothetical protein
MRGGSRTRMRMLLRFAVSNLESERERKINPGYFFRHKKLAPSLKYTTTPPSHPYAIKTQPPPPPLKRSRPVPSQTASDQMRGRKIPPDASDYRPETAYHMTGRPAIMPSTKERKEETGFGLPRRRVRQSNAYVERMARWPFSSCVCASPT